MFDCEKEDFLSEFQVKNIFGDTIYDMLATITSCMYCGIVVATVQYNNSPFVIWNKRATEILGVGATPTSPDQWSERYCIHDPITKLPYDAKELPLCYALRGEFVRDVVLLVRQENKEVYISCNGSPLKNIHGEVVGGVVIFNDITDSIHQKEKMEYMECQLEQINSIKEKMHNIYKSLDSLT